MVVEIFLQKNKTNTKLRRHKSRSDWEISPEAGGWKREKKIKQRKEKIKKGAIWGRRDGKETNAHVIERKKGEMIKHLISRWHLYSKLSDTSDKETKNK